MYIKKINSISPKAEVLVQGSLEYVFYQNYLFKTILIQDVFEKHKCPSLMSIPKNYSSRITDGPILPLNLRSWGRTKEQVNVN